MRIAKMHDVCLISLPKPYLKQPLSQAPIGLLYLAAVLQNENVDVVIKNYSNFSTEEAIEDLPEARLYGITVTSLELPQSVDFCRLIKKRHKRARTILGGPGVITPQYVDFKYVNSIFFGEAESQILEVFNHSRVGTLPSSYVGSPVEDINTIPFPARNLIDYQGGNIFAYDKNYREGGSTIVLSSRGCPFNCHYCSSPSIGNRKVRFRSPENVYEEIKHIKEEYGITQIRFSDDMFTANTQRILELCILLKKLDIVWRISCRSVPNDLELLQSMFDAGLREVSVGVESFDDNVLKFLNKKLTVRDNITMLENCAEVGITTRVLFMIRTPGQTKKTIELNKSVLQQVPYNIVACTTFMPLPGSAIWKDPDSFNVEILDRDLNNYNFYAYSPEGRVKHDPIIKIKDRSLEEFVDESEEFLDWLETTGKLNNG